MHSAPRKKMGPDGLLVPLKVSEYQEEYPSREYPDPTPMQPPVGYNPQPSMFERMREMLQNERLQAELRAAGAETEEEANDFDVVDVDEIEPLGRAELDYAAAMNPLPPTPPTPAAASAPAPAPANNPPTDGPATPAAPVAKPEQPQPHSTLT